MTSPYLTWVYVLRGVNVLNPHPMHPLAVPTGAPGHWVWHWEAVAFPNTAAYEPFYWRVAMGRLTGGSPTTWLASKPWYSHFVNTLAEVESIVEHLV